MSIWNRSLDKEFFGAIQKVGPGSGKGQVTFRMVMLVLFHKEQGQTDISRRNMLTSCKIDYLSSGKYPFSKGSGYPCILR